jgi:UDP-glucose 4-epimerase
MVTDRLRGTRILVTGGAGFIGSEVVHQLANRGVQVVVVDNLINGKRKNLDDISPDDFSLEVADIRDKERMRSVMSKTDMVLHLACLGVRHSIHSPLENHEVNATATLQLLEIARQAGVSRFVQVSSSEIYGTAQTVPMNEQHPAWPMTVYGAAKLSGERYADAYWRTYKFPTVVVRPFNAYGPRSHHEGDSGEVIPKFMLRAMAGRPLIIHGNGAQTRDFTYVADTARGILLAATADEALGQTINLGQGQEISITELADAIGITTGRNDIEVQYTPQRPGDVLRLYADGAKAAKLLAFAPEIGLAAGLRRLHSWYQSLHIKPETLLADEVEVNWHGTRGASSDK